MTVINEKKGTFKRLALSILITASLAAGGCTKTEHRVVPIATAPAVATPSPAQLERVVVESIHVTPSTIRRDQSATATVSLAGAPAGTLLTLAWFDPDGWLASDEQRPVKGGNAVFAVPRATFEKPGTYHGSLDAGAVHLADTTLTVLG